MKTTTDSPTNQPPARRRRLSPRRLGAAGRGLLRRLAAAAVALQIVAASGTPAWAQRRREEPVANPEFQQPQAQPPAGPPGGGPIDEGDEEGAEGEEAPARPAVGVQIGAAAPGRAAPASPLNPLESRVTVRVKGAPLATFLDTISAQSKVNFIITEGLETKQVTAFLQNVTVREALQILLEIKGLTYQQIGKSNTFVIAPRSKAAEPVITRIYTLSYVPLIALGSSSAEQSAISPGLSISVAATGGGAAGAEATVPIVAVLKSVLTKDRGQIALEPRTNALIITDIPEVFPQVEQIIAELDKKTPQIQIEAQIVEINSTRTRDLGVEWGSSSGELASFTFGKRDTSFPLNLPRNLGNTKFFDPITNDLSGTAASAADAAAATAAQASGLSGSGAAGAVSATTGRSLTSAIFDLTQLRITLRALVSRSEARFLGKPKVMTLNNKPAIIQVAANTAVALQQTQSAAGAGGAGTATSAVTVERVITGLVLRVTPQVNKDGYVTMLVQPTFTDTAESSLSAQRQRVFDPITRGASTLVRVKNGQTLVLGGLLQSNETKVVRKVPFLGYIPLLGWLFTTTSTRRINSDLVIFITPTIVSD